MKHDAQRTTANTSSPTSPDKPSRVNCQGITYSICRCCFNVIGSGRSESQLRRAEQAHYCPEMRVPRDSGGH